MVMHQIGTETLRRRVNSVLKKRGQAVRPDPQDEKILELWDSKQQRVIGTVKDLAELAQELGVKL